MTKPPGYVWLSDENYAKLIGQARLHLNQILRPLAMYGQGVIVDDATHAIIELMEQFGKKVRGQDIPYEIKKYRWFNND